MSDVMTREEREAVERAAREGLESIYSLLRENAEEAHRALSHDGEFVDCCQSPCDDTLVACEHLVSLHDAARRYLALTAALDGWEPRCMWGKCKQVGDALAGAGAGARGGEEVDGNG